MQTAGKAVAIITARGGSKRIPHKNIKEFCGKPILAYSIEAALASGVFDRVMVSTDDEEIAEVARKYEAEVPFLRSEKTANDYATTKDVLEEVLAEYENAGNILIPCAVSIPPLLLLHLTGCRRQCACWKKKGGHPASGSTFQLSAPTLRGTGCGRVS